MLVSSTVPAPIVPRFRVLVTLPTHSSWVGVAVPPKALRTVSSCLKHLPSRYPVTDTTDPEVWQAQDPKCSVTIGEGLTLAVYPHVGSVLDEFDFVDGERVLLGQFLEIDSLGLQICLEAHQFDGITFDCHL